MAFVNSILRVFLPFFARARRLALAAATLGAASPVAHAQVIAPVDHEKTRYTLFHPTPDDRLRPLSADRPDGTESPRTVDAGRVQVEASFFDFTRNEEDGEETHTLLLADTNLKIGLTHNTDLQLLFTPYAVERAQLDGPPDEVSEGLSDLILRLKVNLWGNDAGETALGVMPTLKIPTGGPRSGDHVEGGLIAMFGWDFAAGLSLGLQVEAQAVYDAVEDDYDAEVSHTAVLGADLVGALGGFVEYIGAGNSDGDEDYRSIFSTGLTYALGPNTQWDVATRIGLNDAADDVRVFSGITWRY